MEIDQPVSTGTVGNDANVATSLTINPLTSTTESTAILLSEGAPGQHSVRADNWIWTETDWFSLSDEYLQKWFDGLPSLKNVIPDDGETPSLMSPYSLTPDRIDRANVHSVPNRMAMAPQTCLCHSRAR